MDAHAPPLSARSRRGGALASAAAAVCFGLASLALYAMLSNWPPYGLFGPGVATALAWGAFALHLALSGRRLAAFDPGIWVPVLMLLHYFGMPIAVELLEDPLFVDYDAWGVGGPPRLSLSFGVALLTLVGFLCGFHLSGVPELPHPPLTRERTRPLLGPALCLLLGGFAFILIGIPLGGSDLVFGSYGDYKLAMKYADADLRLFGTGFLFAHCGIYALLACHEPGRSWRVVAALAASALLAVFLVISGNRSGLSMLALAGGFVFAQTVRSVRRTPVVVAFAFAMIGMPILGEWREQRDLNSVDASSARHLAAAALYEMGSTLPVFSYTLERIPREKSFDYGLSVLNQLIMNVPNFGAVGRRFGLDPLQHDPDNWVTHAANPVKYQRLLGGYGYAVGAEWYFNFGMPGVLLGMILTGYATGWFRSRARHGATWLTVSALFYAMMLVLVRNDVGYPLRTLLWPLIGLALLQAAWPRRGPRQRAAGRLPPQAAPMRFAGPGLGGGRSSRWGGGPASAGRTWHP